MILIDLPFLVASCASDKAVYLGEIQKTYWNCHSFLFLVIKWNMWNVLLLSMTNYIKFKVLQLRN